MPVASGSWRGSTARRRGTCSTACSRRSGACAIAARSPPTRARGTVRGCCCRFRRRCSEEPGLGVAMVFGRARDAVEDACRAEGIAVRAWREVPVDPDALGPTARASAPQIEQALLEPRRPRRRRARGVPRAQAARRARRPLRALALVPHGRPTRRSAPPTSSRSSTPTSRARTSPSRSASSTSASRRTPSRRGSAPAVPAPLPQRRDQRDPRQRQLDAGAGGHDRARARLAAAGRAELRLRRCSTTRSSCSCGAAARPSTR